MTYFAVGDNLHRHHKLEQLGERGPAVFGAAVTIWTLAGSWCGEQGSGGHVPVMAGGALGTRRAPLVLDPLPHETVDAAIQALVDVGLWEAVEGGYRFHDWADENFTREQEAHKRKLAKERQRRRRDRLRGVDRCGTSGDVTRAVTRDKDEKSEGVTRDSHAVSRVTDTVTDGKITGGVTVTHARDPDPTRPDPDQTPPTARACVEQPGEIDPGAKFGRLYQHWLAVVERCCPGAFRPPDEVTGRHWIREALHHPDVPAAGPGEVERALDLLGVQVQAKTEAGESDPSWPLEKAWRPGVLAEALGWADEKTARTRAVRRSRKGPSRAGRSRRGESVPPARAQDFAQEAGIYIPGQGALALDADKRGDDT